VNGPPDFWRDAENPARPAAGDVLCALKDVPDPGGLTLDFAAGEARLSLLVLRRGEDVCAYFNICPHARMPLERPDGRVVVQEGRYVLCTAHGASFEISSGACVAGPGLGLALRPFPIAVSDGQVIAAA
jgi:nitrite reductase/ring-hydroxylating ferredoxin subunit